MTIYIDNETIEKIKDSGDIVDIVSDYVQLKRSGANFVGLCPFHNEKTPSFTVSQSKQFFHCFGCGESGDLISFVMKRENLDFTEAIKFLGERLGIPIESKEVDKKYINEREEAYRINREAARFFYKNLTTNNNALKYLKKRQISAKTIRKFGLGFAQDNWESLYNYLTKRGFKAEEIEKIGLIAKGSGNNSYYDRFRNRIIFPIIDTRSRVVGFGGRVLDDTMPKYLNSRDSIVFNKGRHLYGLNLVSKFSDREKILLVEGYMDVISLYSRGITYSVASLGTALTEEQGKLLRRYGKEVYICFDSDTAGIKASFKAIDVLLKIGVSPRIVLLPDNMDPDDYINKYGLFEFEKLINQSLHYIDYKIHVNKKKYDLNRPEDTIKFTKEIVKVIKSLKSPVEQDVFIKKISQDTGISKEAIEREIREGSSTYRRTDRKRKINKDRPIIKPVQDRISSGSKKAQLDLIRLAIDNREYFEVINESLTNYNIFNQNYQKIFQLIENEYEDKNSLDKDALFDTLLRQDIDKKLVEAIFHGKLEYEPTDMEQVLSDLINTIILERLEEARKDIIKQIEDIERKKSSDQIDDGLKKLFMRLTDINERIKLLRQE